MDIKKVEKDLLACIDVEKAGAIIVKDVAFAALKKVVDDSSNKFDDAAYAMLAPLLEDKLAEALKEFVEKLKA